MFDGNAYTGHAVTWYLRWWNYPSFSSLLVLHAGLFFNLTTPQVCYFSTEWVIWTAQYEPSLVHGCLDYRTKCSGFLFFLTYCQPEQQHLVPSDRCQVVALTKIIHVYNHGAWLTNSPHHQILYLYYYLNTLSFSIFVSICQWASLGIPKQLEGI